ncbi:aspartyl-phosphate phosphatase Spo0E family protein [Bacillus dakarensis]|uniref:aspartyl-phosphate phosphatase Spo0E family protein n=1 Tax=Robertmurraya dakarensis TaxID=1926278 RepID=UPI001F1F2478|nr:aspartyl-phosphate phosphatase Spo0E family protein [Bacillus dakarensis]
MDQNNEEMLEEIQKKREKMIESARKNGFTSVDTIRYSQELDRLIYDYQCTFQKANHHTQEVKIVFKQMMLIWPKALVNV